MKKGVVLGGIGGLMVAIFAVAWLDSDIIAKTNESVDGIISADLVELSDDNPTFDHWGKNFPDYLDMHTEAEFATPKATEFGGNEAYSKLIRYPQLNVIWSGYAFAIDANEERGHFWVQVDQMDTARNNKDFLNANGLAKFGGQPTACMNCHSGWTPWLLQNTAKGDFVAFNSAKYWTMIKTVPPRNGAKENSPEHNGPHGGKRMGVTCADCHNPKDMSLRITRLALVNALIERGYEKDEKQGVKASRSEMRSLVCSQCHVEYYFKPTGKMIETIGESIAQNPSAKWANGSQKTYDEFDSWRDGNKLTKIETKGIELVFPWKFWPKDKPFRIEMFDEAYDEVRDVFSSDWTHKMTKAKVLKIQHPESELYSGSVHAANGVSCADCHMPYVRKGAKKITNHNLTSPLFNINASCKTCHTQSEKYLANQIKDIQSSIAHDLRTAEYALVSLIKDTESLRDKLGSLEKFQSENKADDAKISAELNEVLELQRKSQMRADFVGAENSTGFHNPREASRILLQSIDMIRQAQAKLLQVAFKNGFSDFAISNLGFEDIQKLNPGEIVYKEDLGGHKKGERYYKHEYINGEPSKTLLEFDKNIKPYNYKEIE